METPLGKRIQQLRKLRGMTQEKLAELCDVSTSCVSRWERGSLHPRADKYPVLAKALKVSVNDFFCSPQVSLPDDVLIREIVSVLEEMDQSEKQFFLNSLKGYLVMKLERFS